MDIKFNKVVFDCDSTLTKIEGIDELAAIKGKYKEVAELTKKAMDGKLNFEQVFSKRLQLIKPEKKDLDQISKLYIKHTTINAKKIVNQLQKLGIEVYLISGGYDIPVKALAESLGISRLNVFANHLIFDKQGRYQGFDKTNPLSKNKGKKKILQLIKQKGDRVVFIGDGMNDWKVNGEVDLFIGFGGVVKRKNLAKKSKFYIDNLASLLDIIKSNSK